MLSLEGIPRGTDKLGYRETRRSLALNSVRSPWDARDQPLFL